MPPARAAIIRHVDDVRHVHNLDSLADLTAALAHIGPRRDPGLDAISSLLRPGPCLSTIFPAARERVKARPPDTLGRSSGSVYDSSSFWQ